MDSFGFHAHDDIAQWNEIRAPAGATCRICHAGEIEGERLVSPCLCSGSVAWVHAECLRDWVASSQRTKCELCKFAYIRGKAVPDPSAPPIMSIEFWQRFGFKVVDRVFFTPRAWCTLLSIFIFILPLTATWMYRLETHLFSSEPFFDRLFTRLSIAGMIHDWWNGLGLSFYLICFTITLPLLIHDVIVVAIRRADEADIAAHIRAADDGEEAREENGVGGRNDGVVEGDHEEEREEERRGDWVEGGDEEGEVVGMEEERVEEEVVERREQEEDVEADMGVDDGLGGLPDDDEMMDEEPIPFVENVGMLLGVRDHLFMVVPRYAIVTMLIAVLIPIAMSAPAAVPRAVVSLFRDKSLSALLWNSEPLSIPIPERNDPSWVVHPVLNLWRRGNHEIVVYDGTEKGGNSTSPRGVSQETWMCHEGLHSAVNWDQIPVFTPLVSPNDVIAIFLGSGGFLFLLVSMYAMFHCSRSCIWTPLRTISRRMRPGLGQYLLQRVVDVLDECFSSRSFFGQLLHVGARVIVRFASRFVILPILIGSSVSFILPKNLQPDPNYLVLSFLHYPLQLVARFWAVGLGLLVLVASILSAARESMHARVLNQCIRPLSERVDIFSEAIRRPMIRLLRSDATAYLVIVISCLVFFGPAFLAFDSTNSPPPPLLPHAFSVSIPVSHTKPTQVVGHVSFSMHESHVSWQSVRTHVSAWAHGCGSLPTEAWWEAEDDAAASRVGLAISRSASRAFHLATMEQNTTASTQEDGANEAHRDDDEEGGDDGGVVDVGGGQIEGVEVEEDFGVGLLMWWEEMLEQLGERVRRVVLLMWRKVGTWLTPRKRKGGTEFSLLKRRKNASNPFSFLNSSSSVLESVWNVSSGLIDGTGQIFLNRNTTKSIIRAVFLRGYVEDDGEYVYQRPCGVYEAAVAPKYSFVEQEMGDEEVESMRKVVQLEGHGHSAVVAITSLAMSTNSTPPCPPNMDLCNIFTLPTPTPHRTYQRLYAPPIHKNDSLAHSWASVEKLLVSPDSFPPLSTFLDPAMVTQEDGSPEPLFLRIRGYVMSRTVAGADYQPSRKVILVSKEEPPFPTTIWAAIPYPATWVTWALFGGQEVYLSWADSALSWSSLFPVLFAGALLVIGGGFFFQAFFMSLNGTIIPYVASLTGLKSFVMMDALHVTVKLQDGSTYERKFRGPSTSLGHVFHGLKNLDGLIRDVGLPEGSEMTLVTHAPRGELRHQGGERAIVRVAGSGALHLVVRGESSVEDIAREVEQSEDEDASDITDSIDSDNIASVSFLRKMLRKQSTQPTDSDTVAEDDDEEEEEDEGKEDDRRMEGLRRRRQTERREDGGGDGGGDEEEEEGRGAILLGERCIDVVRVLNLIQEATNGGREEFVPDGEPEDAEWEEACDGIGSVLLTTCKCIIFLYCMVLVTSFALISMGVLGLYIGRFLLNQFVPVFYFLSSIPSIVGLELIGQCPLGVSRWYSDDLALIVGIAVLDCIHFTGVPLLRWLVVAIGAGIRGILVFNPTSFLASFLSHQYIASLTSAFVDATATSGFLAEGKLISAIRWRQLRYALLMFCSDTLFLPLVVGVITNCILRAPAQPVIGIHWCAVGGETNPSTTTMFANPMHVVPIDLAMLLAQLGGESNLSLHNAVHPSACYAPDEPFHLFTNSSTPTPPPHHQQLACEPCAVQGASSPTTLSLAWAGISMQFLFESWAVGQVCSLILMQLILLFPVSNSLRSDIRRSIRGFSQLQFRSGASAMLRILRIFAILLIVILLLTLSGYFSRRAYLTLFFFATPVIAIPFFIIRTVQFIHKQAYAKPSFLSIPTQIKSAATQFLRKSHRH